MAAPELQLGFHRSRPPVHAGRGAVERALDLLPIGIVFVDPAARVMRHNGFAYAILVQNDGLRVDRHGLGADSATESRALRQAIARIGESGVEAAMAITRPSGRPDLWLAVGGLGNAHLADRAEPSAVVTIVDPEHSFAPQPATMQRAFGFTEAEARLGRVLALGHSIDEAAQQLGIARNTARVHLQRMFGKTGATRQGQLVRLLVTRCFSLSGPAAPPQPPRPAAVTGGVARIGRVD